MDFLINFLISWGPLILMAGFWGYMLKKGHLNHSKYYERCGAYMSEHLAETRKLNQNLERIAMALEKQAAKTDVEVDSKSPV